MKYAKILISLALGLVLMGCSPLPIIGVKVDELPKTIRESCASPDDLLVRGETVADDFISVRKLGDELTDCERKREIAADAYEDLRQKIDGTRWYEIF